MNRFRAYVVPAVMACVATTQLVLVHTRGLNSWRGGGFGMYARFHPRNNEAWFETGVTRTRFVKYDESAGPVESAVNWSLTMTNGSSADQLREVISARAEKQGRISIYRLDFEPRTMKLTRELLVVSDEDDH